MSTARNIPNDHGLSLRMFTTGLMRLHQAGKVTNAAKGVFDGVSVTTFALGTALGDLTAVTFHLGYLASGVAFAVIIAVPAVAWRFFGLNEVVAFWFAYVVTRPLGASFADYFSKAHALSGLAFGDGPTAIVLNAAVIVLVAYVAITKCDIQSEPHVAHVVPQSNPGLVLDAEFE